MRVPKIGFARTKKTLKGGKKKRSLPRKRRLYFFGYKRGSKDGFARGREFGFARGLEDALAQLEKNRQDSETPVEQHGEVNVSPAATGVYDALVISPGMLPSLEIGILQPFRFLERQHEFRFDLAMEGEVTPERIMAAKTIIFLRNVEPVTFAYFQWAKEQGKRIVYVIDDNFLEIDPATPLGGYYTHPARRETFIQFLQGADVVKVDSKYFGSWIHRQFNPNAVYFPASFDFDWIDIEKPERNDGTVVIGYAGGHKEKDFLPVVPALKKILDYYGGFVRMEFFGFLPSGLAGHPNVAFIEGIPDYKAYTRRLYECTWDIGLAPLEESMFNSCKSNNKFRDYSSCWIPGVYSAVPPYTDWAVHGETGYLIARHEESAWYAGLKQMIEDPQLRKQIKNDAGRLAREHFSLAACAEEWRKLLDLAYVPEEEGRYD